MNQFVRAKRIVIKIGSSSLTYENGMLNLRKIEAFCKVLADIKNSGKEIVLVSSGAIAVGVAKLGLKHGPESIPEKQAAAAVGQCELMHLYEQTLSPYHHKIAQILLTRDIIDTVQRKNNAKNTFDTLLSYGVIPVVNENDTVSTEEIEFGDNDTLSAIVASLIGADGLVLLSDIDGLYTDNPSKNPQARLIPLVGDITPDIEQFAGGAGSDRGTGGMATKISAARICMENGCAMAILNSNPPENLYSLLEGKPVGTLFAKGASV